MFPRRLPIFVFFLGMLVISPRAVCAEDVHGEGKSPGEWKTLSAEAYREMVRADFLSQRKLRFSVENGVGAGVTPEADAAGAVDGVKDGTFGFHTAMEADPWWAVDLGQVFPLTKIVLWNRGDSCGERNNHIRVAVRNTAEEAWREIYRHDGTLFGGAAGGKPLEIPLNGVPARYVRLSLDGTVYLHLDEVEIFSRENSGDGESEKNVARGKPATQSSASEWSKAAEILGHTPDVTVREVAEHARRAVKLAETLTAQGVDVSAEMEMIRIALHVAVTKNNTQVKTPPEETLFAIHEAVRRMTFKNPLLNGVEEILFVKRQTTMFPHVSDQHLGWWSRPGGGIFVLRDFRTRTPKIRCLTEAFPEGNFDTPELSYDGKRILFAFCKYYPEVADTPDKTQRQSMPEDSFYHVFEMNTDGTAVRQLTRGYYNDFSPRYLPGGDVIFLSTRKGTSIQAGRESAQATEVDACAAESFVRCGGDNFRPVSVFTLHRMNADGERIRAVSAFENFEWTPTVARDGRIFYARWDYIDRFNGHFMSLWATNPDGTFPNLVYGNYTVRPQVVFEAVQIPASRKMVFTATAHHSITGGSLAVLDRTRGTEGDEPLERVTPEVPFPETERNVGHYYANPWPLSETFFLCSWNDKPLPPHSCMTGLADPRNPGNAGGIYVYDVFGNLTLLFRDPEITSAYPIPLRPREVPAVLPDLVEDETQLGGTFFVQDAHAGLPAEMRGEVKRLRIVAVLPKVQPHMNAPVLGVSAEDTGKAVLGTVPVEADGSAFFRVPAGVSVFFQALNEDGYALQTMRSLTYVQPGQNISCVGCHESRESAPPESAKLAEAFLRDPSRISPDPDGSWPLRYDRLVQPILDRRCVECHAPFSDVSGVSDLSGNPLTTAQKKAARDFSLRLEDDSYVQLLDWNGRELFHLVYEKDRSVAGDAPALKSGLMKIFSGETPHFGVRLTPAERYALAVWMDTYAHRIGSFSPRQEEELEAFREKIAPLLAAPK